MTECAALPAGHVKFAKLLVIVIKIYSCVFTFQEHWTTALKTLDLTLDEVVHIRSVLTKAELEALPLEGELKHDVEKGRVSGRCNYDFS